MKHSGWKLSAIAAPAILLLTAASSVSAQRERELLAWNGSVDREVEITMRGNDAWVRGLGDNDRTNTRVRVISSLPRQDGYVGVSLRNGRGDVNVIQQPSARNNYTTVIRVRDRNSGAARYDLRAWWEPLNSAGWGRDRDRDRGPDWNRGRGNDRDDDWYDRGRSTRLALSWSGRVDDVVEIRLRGGRVEYRVLSGQRLQDVRTDAGRRALPRDDAQYRLERVSGRGDVRIVQQPTPRNGYTTIIRVRDPNPGYGRYSFDLTWRDDGRTGRGIGDIRRN